MIYTLTLNPSIDYFVTIDDLKIGDLNRTQTEEIFPGGKGINVSLMLKNLGIESTALGFVGGFVGNEIKRLLEEKDILTDFVFVKENSRINVKARSISSNCDEPETEINGRGPVISDVEYNELICKLEKITSEDMVVIAGAIPYSLPGNIYSDFIELLNKKNVKVILDTSGQSLSLAIDKKPYLIKPNKKELEELFKVAIPTKEKAIEYGKKVKDMGAQNVLVSLGNNGAVMITENGETYSMDAPKGRVINTIGAGDSCVAGFIAGLDEYQDIQKAFCMGVCAGSASAFSVGMATKELIYELMDNI